MPGQVPAAQTRRGPRTSGPHVFTGFLVISGPVRGSEAGSRLPPLVSHTVPPRRVSVLTAQEFLLSLGTPCLWPAAGRQPEPGSGPALSPARSPRVLLQVVFHDVGVLTDKLFPVVEAMQKHFSAGSGTYYSDSIFFLSVAMHQIMPKGNLCSDVCVCPPGASVASALHPREELPRGRGWRPCPLWD